MCVVFWIMALVNVSFSVGHVQKYVYIALHIVQQSVAHMKQWQ